MQYLTVTVLSAAGTKARKTSVRTSICPLHSPTLHHSTVECRPAELNRLQSKLFLANLNALATTRQDQA